MSQPPGSTGDKTGSGVKPQIFDFTSATSKPNANAATPGGYFFGGKSERARSKESRGNGSPIP